MSLQNKKITIGISGGIAAYKTPNLIRLLKKDGAEVRAIMTEAATKFITELTIESVCQYPVGRQMFPNDRYVATHHIDMAEWPDIIVVVPATADLIAKIAAGLCDDLLTTVICATKAPIMLSPAMNSNMYLNPITQKNIEYLKSLGYTILDPNTGEMACETEGPGRMPEPQELFEYVSRYFEKKKPLKNKRVLVTAGPCRENIDPVRFISNRSSGKMGFALARAAYDAGAETNLVSGPTNLETPYGVKRIDVESTEQMYNAVREKFGTTDFLIMAAAPADFRPSEIRDKKIKKGNLDNLQLDLRNTIDILKGLRGVKKDTQKIIGFALETDNGLENAKAKLREKGLDLIVLNSLEEGVPFEGQDNKVTVISPDGEIDEWQSMTKDILARKLIGKIALL